MITKNVIFILKIQFVKNKFKNLENTKELIYEKDFYNNDAFCFFIFC
jgi:hypothetical protein